jgi:hypothetical protein
MLESLSDQIRDCLRHADDCVQQAASQTDPKLCQDYLILGACWLKLSYELSELADFPKSKSNEPGNIVSPQQTGHPTRAAGNDEGRALS